MKNFRTISVLCAILAAAFYALNVPFSKILLKNVSPAMLAGFLYLGAGVGIGAIYAFKRKNVSKECKLGKSDLPYTVLMVVLDVAAPVLLMLGLKTSAAANASLLNNFEIVATTVIALVFFKEKVPGLLWAAIILISAAGAVLSFENVSAFTFSGGSLLVIAAASCWGLENNCTRKISDKNACEIVTVKGICSGCGSIVVALIAGETFPKAEYVLYSVLLGFVAYGLSITLYVTAQKTLGAAKTSAYYAIAPFIGAAFSAIFLKESFSARFFIAFGIMIAGTVLASAETFRSEARSKSDVAPPPENQPERRPR